MSAKTFTAEDAQAANLVLLGTDKGRQAVHDLITAYRANRRSGTAQTKTRGEVSGSNRKIYKQKGTGNARHGDNRAPIFVGGGVVFGPRHRDYSKKVTKSVRRVALRRVLGDVISGGKVSSTDAFAIQDGKTKSFISAINDLGVSGKVLVISSQFDESTFLAARNVAWVQLVTPAEVNVEQLLLANHIVFVGDAAKLLAERTA